MSDLTFLAELDWLRLDLLARLLLAAVLGGVVGLEREWSGKPAGFRTNMLICVGAALLMELSRSVASTAGEIVGGVGDPGRIAAQIVSGIGFLGAGTIIQSRAGVTGLTTAATLWVVAAIGMAVGAEAYLEAVGTTVLVVIALLVLGKLEGKLVRVSDGVLRVRMEADRDLADRVESLLKEHLSATLVELERSGGDSVATYRASGHPRRWGDIVARLGAVDGVRSVRRS